MKILANDGLSQSGIRALQNAGFEVITTHVAQEQLVAFVNNNQIKGLLVRSATQVGKDVIDGCKNLKLIGRGGVGMDNIDVVYAKKKDIHVINTPAASSQSVAELVFAHLYGAVRFLYDSNRNMPLEGDSNFKQLKKAYSLGTELKGKTLGIIGFGKIGQATAKIAIGAGMQVVYHDPDITKCEVTLQFYDKQTVGFQLTSISQKEVLSISDFITIHVPSQQNYVLGAEEFAQMKDGVGVINVARGGVLDEVALINAMESKKVAFAALDVFESEPTPEIQILMHPNISLSPHIGAATLEAQDRIGLELASQIITLFK